jgi:hypothetical protein
MKPKDLELSSILVQNFRILFFGFFNTISIKQPLKISQWMSAFYAKVTSYYTFQYISLPPFLHNTAPQ